MTEASKTSGDIHDLISRVETFRDQSTSVHLSNEYFESAVDQLYFGRLGIPVDDNVRNRYYLDLLKMHHLFLKTNKFAQVYFRGKEIILG